MQAHLLSLNDFRMPLVYTKNAQASFIHLVYLILLDKGKFPTHPDMGVGVRSRYRFKHDEGTLNELRQDIADQIATYLPDLSGVEVSVNISKTHILGIVVRATEGIFTLAYDTETDKVNAPAEYLLEDL